MSDNNSNEISRWTNDQIAKSQFFHKKLHEWKLLEIVDELEDIDGEKLEWNFSELGISKNAWDKVIHRGIKPILVFANPAVITSKPNRIMYYRSLALVSQKSMNKVKLSTSKSEIDNNSMPTDKVRNVCIHLNKIINILVESDKEINPDELILWRGMSAGSQAQGSWQNMKGDIAEVLIKTLVVRKILETGLITQEIDPEITKKITLSDGRTLVFGSEPDIASYRNTKIETAVEIKGGIDPAGVLERFGAALKSLKEAKKENRNATTILVMEKVSLTDEVEDRIKETDVIDYFFTIDELTKNPDKRIDFFTILNIGNKPSGD